MVFRDYLKIFVAGLVFPSILFPFFELFLAVYGAMAIFNEVPAYLVGIIWGIWNLLYFTIVKDRIDHVPSKRLVFGIYGAMLGLLLYFIATLAFHAPSVLQLPSWLVYSLVLIVPVVYFLVWYYLVAWFNDLMGFEI